MPRLPVRTLPGRPRQHALQAVHQGRLLRAAPGDAAAVQARLVRSIRHVHAPALAAALATSIAVPACNPEPHAAGPTSAA